MAVQPPQDASTRIEFWWAEIDGRGQPQPVEVTHGSAYAEIQDPPRPWHACMIGSEAVLWPDRVRLLQRIAPLDSTEISVRLESDGCLTVRGGGSGAMRIVASSDMLPNSAGQRVAELIRDAIALRDREVSGRSPEPSPGFLASLKAATDRIGAQRRRPIVGNGTQGDDGAS